MGDLDGAVNGAASGQPAIDRSVERVIEHIKDAYPLRVPRSEGDRRNGFAAWLERHREQLAPVMCRAVAAEGLAEDAVASDAERIAEERVWPKVAEFLRGFAVLGHAGSWGSHHYYDTTTMCWPERQGNLWRIRLGVRGYEGEFGQVTLDAEGNVLPDLTTTRDQILEALGGHSRTPAATASRKQ